MLKTAATCAALCAAIAPQNLAAETAGIQNHKVQKLFMEAPCSDAISAIDNPGGARTSAQDSNAELAQPILDLGWTAMAFGFLMGYEATRPGIRGTHETILMRLRDDCASDSTRTAMEILQGYSAN